MNYIFDTSFIQEYEMNFGFLSLARQRACSFFSECIINLKKLLTKNPTFMQISHIILFMIDLVMSFKLV